MSHTDYVYVPFEYPKSRDGLFTALIDDGQVLRVRREQLGLSQQQVAEMAGIQFSQYQRLESGDRFFSGCSMKIGLSVCTVLLLDPYDFFDIDVQQPDPATLKPMEPFDKDKPFTFEFPKRVGRKPIRRDIMTVYVNYKDYSLLIPYDVLSKLGEPDYIQLRWSIPDRRIIVLAVSESEESAFDVPKERFENSILALPYILTDDNPIAAMNWGERAHSVESRLVRNNEGTIALLIDLNTAKPTDKLDSPYVFMMPECLTEEDNKDEYFDDDDDEDFEN